MKPESLSSNSLRSAENLRRRAFEREALRYGVPTFLYRLLTTDQLRKLHRRHSVRHRHD